MNAKGTPEIGVNFLCPPHCVRDCAKGRRNSLPERPLAGQTVVMCQELRAAPPSACGTSGFRVAVMESAVQNIDMSGDPYYLKSGEMAGDSASPVSDGWEAYDRDRAARSVFPDGIVSAMEIFRQLSF